jgi:hypothetical protein
MAFAVIHLSYARAVLVHITSSSVRNDYKIFLFFLHTRPRPRGVHSANFIDFS